MNKDIQKSWKEKAWPVLVVLGVLGVLYVAVPTAIWIAMHPEDVGDTSFHQFAYLMSYLPAGFGMYFMGFKYALDYTLFPGYALYAAFGIYVALYYKRNRFPLFIAAWVVLLLVNMGGCMKGEQEILEALAPLEDQ